MRKTVKSLVESLDAVKKEFRSTIKNRVESYKNRLKRIEAFYCFIQEALSAGFVPNYDEWSMLHSYSDSIDVTIDNVRDFSIVHKLVGNLEHCHIEPAKDDGRCREVIVTLRPKNKQFSFLRFKFKRKLPKGSKCKIVTQKRSYVSVVCEA